MNPKYDPLNSCIPSEDYSSTTSDKLDRVEDDFITVEGEHDYVHDILVVIE